MKYVNYVKIKPHFNRKGLGTFDTIKGKQYRYNFNVYEVKYLDYVLLLIEKYGAENPMGRNKLLVSKDVNTVRKIGSNVHMCSSIITTTEIV